MDTPSKRQALLWILIFSLVIGLVDGLFPKVSPNTQLWSLISSIVFLVLSMRWFTLDARLHNYQFSKPMFLCLVVLMAFTAPFYFFATRRAAFWKSLLKSALFFLVLSFIAGLGTVATQTLMAHLR